MRSARPILGVLGALFVAGALAAIWQQLRTPGETAGLSLERHLQPKTEPVAAVDGPNVVLIIGCTLRRDQLSVYRPTLDTTPTLEALAAKGALFEDAISAAPWTRAASVAILTGQHAVSLGMVEPGPERNDRPLPEAIDTLAEHFQRAGYRTFGLTTNPNLNRVYGFGQGFEAYWQPRGLWRDNMHKLDYRPVIAALSDDLPDAAARPLYLQVLLVDAHAPYPELSELSAEEQSGDLSPNLTRYRAAVRRFDQGLEQLMALLEERNYTLENTLFVVLSDHGEGLEMPAHHGRAHGRHLYPSSVRSLWLMAGPGVPAGQRINGVVSQVDVPATVLAMTGLSAPSGPGIDQRPGLISGVSQRSEAFADTWFLSVQRSALYTDSEACQQDFSGTEGESVWGCFDRASDPDHHRPRTHTALQAQLSEWHQARVGEFLQAGHGGAVPITVDLDQQLEALGYRDP